MRGYELIGVVGNFTKLLKAQDAAIQSEYLPFYKNWSSGGSPYINAVLPMNIMGLKRSAEEKAADFKAKVVANEADGNTEQAEAMRVEMDKWYDLAEEVTEVLRQLMN